MVEFPVPEGAVRGKVFYNNGEYKEFEVTGPVQSVVVEGLSEDEHILRVVTINASGIVSDPKAVKVTAYGETYESTLRPRRWKDQLDHSSTNIEILFDPAFANETELRVLYTTTGGQKDSVSIGSDKNAVVIDNIDLDQPYFYYSVYKPQVSNIDDFYSEDVDAKNARFFNFRKDGWEIAGSSDELTNHTAAMAIDNDPATYWQSAAAPSAQNWISIDLGSSKVINGFSLLNPYTNDKSAKSIRIDVSNDNATWTKVLETSIGPSYLRQLLPLSEPVTVRYFRITAIEMFDSQTPGMVFSEIDAYNANGLSAENGLESYTATTPVELENAQAPFVGDGSNPFPLLGDYRLQKVKDWIHSPNAVATYDNTKFTLFTAAVWGLPTVTNGKIHQSLNLSPGHYILKIDMGSASGPVDIYGAVTSGGALPDYTTIAAATPVLRYMDLVPYFNKVATLPFQVTTAGSVSIGFVYNIRSQYSSTGVPWSTLTINGLELIKVDLSQ
ncbi:hypothetical protein GCM10027051_33520 [Niabella terrae]